MKHDLTDLVFILDCSGSVQGLEGDTIGGATRHIGNIHKYARPEDMPEHTLFAVTTNGMENAGRRYLPQQIKEKMPSRETSAAGRSGKRSPSEEARLLSEFFAVHAPKEEMPRARSPALAAEKGQRLPMHWLFRLL